MAELRPGRGVPQRQGTGLTIHVEGGRLVHFRPKNHLGMGDDVRYVVTDGPVTIGDRWYARSVRPLMDDDGYEWLVGFGASCSVVWEGCSFGSCPDGHAVAWRTRVGEDWSHYA